MNINNNFSSIEQVTGQYLNTPARTSANTAAASVSFEEILRKTQQTSELKFSKHAGERLASRNIYLTDDQISRLEEGTKLAEEKGINESLMIMDELAFIVNVPNNTVITALDSRAGSDSNVFTNIDGAVII